MANKEFDPLLNQDPSLGTYATDFCDPVNPYDSHDGNPGFHQGNTLFDEGDEPTSEIQDLTQYGDINVVPDVYVLGQPKHRKKLDAADDWLRLHDDKWPN